jgi:transcriptional regulator with XRE-family HTH domain
MAAARGAGKAEASAASVSLGKNVRGERERAGLSVRELARRLGVSASFLSQFELGQSQASVSTLFAIVRELNLSLDELLGHSVLPTKQVKSKRGAQLRDTGAGPLPASDYLSFQTGVRWRRLTDEVGNDRVDFLLSEYEPGSDSAPANQPQQHKGNDYGFVLEGTLTAIVNSGRKRRIKEGQAIAMRGDVPHRLLNETDKLVRAIWFVTG